MGFDPIDLGDSSIINARYRKKSRWIFSVDKSIIWSPIRHKFGKSCMMRQHNNTGGKHASFLALPQSHLQTCTNQEARTFSAQATSLEGSYIRKATSAGGG
jgi:hypothetical protein